MPLDAGSPATEARDGGSTSLQVVLLTPVLAVLMFAGFQAALWNHARAEMRSVARATAVAVARTGLEPEAARRQAAAALDGSAVNVGDVTVTESGGGGPSGARHVVVSIGGEAPGIIRGTSVSVRVEVLVPVEGWTP